MAIDISAIVAIALDEGDASEIEYGLRMTRSG
jgi:uncharacterized protein with PIN domain